MKDTIHAALYKLAEVMGSNPIGASEFFLGCEDHFHLYSISAVQSYDLYHIHICHKLS